MDAETKLKRKIARAKEKAKIAKKAFTAAKRIATRLERVWERAEGRLEDAEWELTMLKQEREDRSGRNGPIFKLGSHELVLLCSEWLGSGEGWWRFRIRPVGTHNGDFMNMHKEKGWAHIGRERVDLGRESPDRPAFLEALRALRDTRSFSALREIE